MAQRGLKLDRDINRRPRRRDPRPLARTPRVNAAAQTLKLSPQPQRLFSFGLMKTKPDCSLSWT